MSFFALPGLWGWSTCGWFLYPVLRRCPGGSITEFVFTSSLLWPTFTISLEFSDWKFRLESITGVSVGSLIRPPPTVSELLSLRGSPAASTRRYPINPSQGSHFIILLMIGILLPMLFQQETELNCISLAEEFAYLRTIFLRSAGQKMYSL